MRYRPVCIGPNVIDLWRWPLDVVAGDLPRYVAMVSDGEFARAARFVHERDRLRFLVGRGRLREIVAHYLGVSAKRLVFVYNAFGKPHLAMSEPPLHFNLSHSGGMAVLAVSDRYHVGVDVEQVLPLKEDVAGHFFSPAEQRALSAMPPGDYLEAFYRCWTRKEAFVKAHGAGLSLPLDAFDVSIDEREPTLLRLDGDPAAPLQWQLAEIALPRGFIGAVAAPTGGNGISLRYRSALEDEREEEWTASPRPLRPHAPFPGDQLFNRASRM
ncbi:4'-phosphopantetheinyl transferase superfamily protein [Chelativorans sp. AA-79]|uniref:4'-phosphopantetheinyl transferase family protein n=1 Tax=Chelativorans sp. AA-79 TaxID=3028735 RepID=UPI0023F7B0D7|nr:4'-phosphopantetheinyl transferase superfamily protein [Chelativorans sp. AA-79]WEX10484.1 4'-phosphopantetheinyl transferase superfamily protein [Chelativorans sp. AA-79]